jgi:hypothetical protein
MTFALKAFSEIPFAGLGDIEVALTGVNGTASAGDEVINISVSVSASGISALTGTLGSESVTAGASVAASTNVGTTSLGSESVTAGSNVAVTNVAGTTSLGSESVSGTSSVSVSGIAGASALGDETAIPSIEVAVTGVSATATASNDVNAGEEIFRLVGVSATGSIGNVLIWTETIPLQAVVEGTLTRTAQFAAQSRQADFYITDPQADPNYTALTTGVSQSYTEITPSTSTTWTDKAA